jgi:hypothetical protein
MGATLLSSSAAGQTGSVIHVVAGGGSAGRGLGHAVAGAGDVDGDGFADVIVGYRSGNAAAGTNAGAAQVISGRDGTLLWTLLGSAAQDELGRSVDGVGDVDGDGTDDVVVGAAGEDANGLDAGAVYVLSGRDGTVLHRLVGDFASMRLGYAVSGAGDVDGDGAPDLIVGGQPEPLTPQPVGFARLYSGRDGTVLRDLIGPTSLSRLGCAVDAAGDVDGDGTPDVVVGDWRDPAAGNQAGSVSVFSGADGSRIHYFVGDKSNDRLGLSVSAAGDVDGDGVPDVLGATPIASGAMPYAGLVRVWSGADGSVLHSLSGNAMLAFFGGSAAGVGDFDGDGRDDFAIGAYADSAGGATAGSVRVHSGADGSELWRRDGSAGDELGYAVAGAGDVDGDGGADLIAGAPADDQGGGPLSGAAYAVAGATPPPPQGPVTYCTPGPNTLGPGANIGWSGSTSVSRADLVLTVAGATPRRPGFFFYGNEQQQRAFQRGYLCVKPPPHRVRPLVFTSRAGDAKVEPRLVGGRRPDAMTPGSTWNFQFVYLDRCESRHGALNLSDALSVTFTP